MEGSGRGPPPPSSIRGRHGSDHAGVRSILASCIGCTLHGSRRHARVGPALVDRCIMHASWIHAHCTRSIRGHPYRRALHRSSTISRGRRGKGRRVRPPRRPTHRPRRSPRAPRAHGGCTPRNVTPCHRAAMVGRPVPCAPATPCTSATWTGFQGRRGSMVRGGSRNAFLGHPRAMWQSWGEPVCSGMHLHGDSSCSITCGGKVQV